MKTLFSLFFLFVFLVVQELPKTREQYQSASTSKQNAEEFYDLLSAYNKNNPTMLGYKGASIALKSKYASTVKLKKQFFIEGVTILENAIKSDPNNTEIRLIRLSIQENTPKILKYKANIEEDKKIILATFDKLPQDLKEFIQEYVKLSKGFTEKEKQQILK